MRKAKIDANQPELVEYFRAAGLSIAITSSAHDGFPDLVIGFNGVTVLCEVKNGSLAPSKRKLTPEQVKFHAEFTGAIVVVESITQAASVVSYMKSAAQLLKSHYKLPGA